MTLIIHSYQGFVTPGSLGGPAHSQTGAGPPPACLGAGSMGGGRGVRGEGGERGPDQPPISLGPPPSSWPVRTPWDTHTHGNTHTRAQTYRGTYPETHAGQGWTVVPPQGANVNTGHCHTSCDAKAAWLLAFALACPREKGIFEVRFLLQITSFQSFFLSL